jgi:hypothetical protein
MASIRHVTWRVDVAIAAVCSDGELEKPGTLPPSPSLV